MSRVWFAQDLETVATFWRIERRDGVALGFVGHDRDLWFDGLLHRAAPGMTPAAIRRSAGLDADSAEVAGALTHDALDPVAIAAGRFAGARVAIGLVDWQSLETAPLYEGTIGAVTEEGTRFQAAIASAKAGLRRDTVPRTSPACRAQFCGPGCLLPAARYTRRAVLAGLDRAGNAVLVDPALDAARYAGGSLRWLDGPLAGLGAAIGAATPGRLVLAEPLPDDSPGDPGNDPGTGRRVLLREGCDRTLATCAGRFGNALNFQGEPYLPGTDFVTRAAPAG